MDWNLYINFFVAIIAILNPLTILSLWSQLTGDVSRRVRLRTASLVIVFAMVTLSAFLVGGKYILKFFSIDLMVFKVAGGILLLTTGIKMVEGLNVKLKDREDGDGSPLHMAKVRFRKIIVPMVIPMIVGPGSITTMILFGTHLEKLLSYIALPAILILYLAGLGIVLTSLNLIEKKIDKIVFTAFTRLLGIIVTAIALQFILEGLGAVFPNWLDSSSPVFNSNGNVPAN